LIQVAEARHEAEEERRKGEELQQVCEQTLMENERLRRQIEIITQLKSTDSLRAKEQESQSYIHVDCDWSQQQLYASDVSA